MNRNIIYIIASFLLLMLLWGCSSARITDQLQFGILAAQKDLWDEAIFRWKKVLQENPSSAAAHNNLAVAYEQKGLVQEADREYLTALELSPRNSYIQSNYQKFKERYEEINEIP
jgi:Flp pilus assembly protein TadD